MEKTSSVPQWKRFGCYFSLLAIGLEIAWSALLFMALIFMVGDEPFTNTPGKARLFDLLDSFPVVIGLIVGILALAQRWPEHKKEWICLVAGSMICGVWTLGFAWGLVN